MRYGTDMYLLEYNSKIIMVKSKGFPFYFCTFYPRIPLEQIKKNNTISHAMPIRDFTKEIGTWWIKI